MSALRGVKPQSEFFVVRTLCFTVLLAFFAHAPGTFGQEQPAGRLTLPRRSSNILILKRLLRCRIC